MSKEWYLIRQPYYTEGSEKQDLLFDSEMSFRLRMTISSNGRKRAAMALR